MTKNELVRLGGVLKELRLKNNYTLEEVGNMLGVTHKSVQFWEQGVNEIKLAKFIMLCSIYKTTIDSVLESAGIV